MRASTELLRRVERFLRSLAVPAAPRGQLALVVYPFDLNPYQEMLYEAIRQSGTPCTVVYVQRRAHLGPIPFFLIVTVARLRGFRLIHVHWPQFGLRRGTSPLYRLSLVNARLSLWWLRVLGIAMVWTVHNVMPHDRETHDDAVVSRILARDAARKIMHSTEAIAELAAIGADSERVSVIPHGVYTGSYREVDRPQGRNALGLPAAARIVLFFGQIRSYKGVEDLIEVWDAEVTDPSERAFLLVAGKCDDAGLRERLDRDARSPGRRFDEGYVAPDRLSLYFAAADVVVLPFRRVTTSGSALLALSLGRPIVAPRIGALRDLPDDVGFFYEADGLGDALHRALDASGPELQARSAAARRYAQSVSWEEIAQSTVEVYQQAARVGPPCRLAS